jgi:hypothetical protein
VVNNFWAAGEKKYRSKGQLVLSAEVAEGTENFLCVLRELRV